MLPMVMGTPEIATLTAGFAASARLAVASGCDGVEVEAGDRSILRQFLSGLTNARGDAYGTDKALLLREVLTAVRTAIGPTALLSLRLSCDELAPWAGITPEHAARTVAELAELIDVLVVVRAGPYAGSAYRPDAHEAEGFNVELCAGMQAVVGNRVRVVLQGSIVTGGFADKAVTQGVADLVEMTRAQIAEPSLVAHLRAGTAPRPCVLCNQACRVRDSRNPLVSCIGEPRSGYETTEPDVVGRDAAREVLVVGGGPAGLESARVLALRGHRVEIREATASFGGAVNDASLGAGRRRLRDLTDWLLTMTPLTETSLTGGDAVNAIESKLLILDLRNTFAIGQIRVIGSFNLVIVGMIARRYRRGSLQSLSMDCHLHQCH